MTILDTNVFSELMKEKPEARVLSWLDALAADSVWTTAVTVFEIQHGLGILADGRKRRALMMAFQEVLRDELGGRVLDFNSIAATEAAAIAVKLRGAGSPVEVRDVMIAGTVAAHSGSTLATRNTKHFLSTGIALVEVYNLR